MEKRRINRRALCLVLSLLPGLSLAQIELGTTDQSDGDMVITGNTVLDLNRAAYGAWDSPSPVPGFGVYDPNKWAVVFKCHNLTVSANASLTFTNRILGGNPPVVFLVQNQVQIDGSINVGSGGPGGFFPNNSAAGRGPGGADTSSNSSAGHSQPGSGPAPGRLYGNSAIIPLVGGSAAAQMTWPGGSGPGGPGGGCLLLACRNSIVLNGQLLSNAAGGGSGGSIKVVANSLIGNDANSQIQAVSNGYYNMPAGSPGRVRLEFNFGNYPGLVQPLPSVTMPSTPATLWPSTSDPSLVVEQVGGLSVPTDPSASWQLTQEDVTLFDDNPVTVQIHAYNIPLNWHVEVRVVPRIDPTIVQQATFVSGNQSDSLWTATVTFPRGQCAIQARAWL